MFAKRVFDVIASLFGLALLSIPLVIIAAAIWLSDRGPVFYRQERVGKDGSTFRILKFRTMIYDAEKRGLQLTSKDDPRITPAGRFLRKTKLDELPQLFNVLRGDMSLVGPRPEVPRYVAFYKPEEKALILSVQPGITDPASIKFKNENQLLANAANADETYVNIILPQKIAIYLEYVKTRTLLGDIGIIFETLLKIAR